VTVAGALVLIVEDNEKNLKLARDLLEFSGFRVIAASDAETGVVLARERLPNLILMDVQLPGMDGFGALAALRADPATAGLKVVAFTASVMNDDLTRIDQVGFDGYIAKPISAREFPAQVRRYCEQSPGG
jgi:two-component system cell cycle response regulator DivK